MYNYFVDIYVYVPMEIGSNISIYSHQAIQILIGVINIIDKKIEEFCIQIPGADLGFLKGVFFLGGGGPIAAIYPPCIQFKQLNSFIATKGFFNLKSS